MISCEICNKVLASFKKLSKHCRKKHPRVEIIQCCFCDYLTKEDLLFKHHKDDCHPMERLRCEYCEFTSRRWKRIKKHYARAHLTSNETNCNSTEMHESTSIEELQCTNLEEKEMIVDLTLVKTEPTVNDVHNLTSNKTIGNSTQMHESTGIEKLQCTNLEEKERIVDFTLVKTEPTVDDVHNADCTQQTSFVCDVCKKMFKTESHLSCHQLVHTAAQFYICSLCDRDVGSAEMYDVHLIRRHFLPKPFKCELCDKSFTLKRNLATHKRSHVKELIHKCDKCNYQTYVKYRMKCHQVYHSNLKPYKCISCDYACFHLNNLYSHVKVHTGEKPFRCNICYKRFSQHSGLKTHKKHNHLL